MDGIETLAKDTSAAVSAVYSFNLRVFQILIVALEKDGALRPGLMEATLKAIAEREEHPELIRMYGDLIAGIAESSPTPPRWTPEIIPGGKRE